MSIKLKRGVNLHVIPTTKYKTVRIMVRFSSPLEVDTISKRTLLASLLETNSQKYATQQQLSEKLAELYGASYGINIGKKGDTHLVSAVLNVVNDKFLPGSEDVLAEGISFLKEVLFYPNFDEQLFNKDTFEREKANLIDYIASVYDDKQSQAALALQELYFAESPSQKIPSFGTVESVTALSLEDVTAYYHRMMATDTVDIMVIGDVTEEAMVSLFSSLPFNERRVETQLDFYEQDTPIEKREKVETLSVTQAKLNMGYHTGVYYHDANYFALQIFNGLFGGFPHSKLFMNVREKESMAYYASSSLDSFRGLITVQTGIDSKNKERVLTLVDEQLASLVAGDISSEDMNQTKEMLKNQYFLSLDNPGSVLEAAYLADKVKKSNLTDKEWVAGLEAVSVADVQAIAKKLSLQAVYFMEGESLSNGED
ncbi:EF-P 5-aminopentanol modification-associated protein YfmF [Vagococcus intermedius]|uniref:Insulinase family protein n=1 Tax=Vagococcus intermedius TaxID=2991418 RepID=A0AAF0I7M2_9ENTE|nr:pitrilysin family protein [Vagococcus intermedius]WEG73424.1 insulinase family protein [Vagococcus intermedius]WEG75507.1 insulinase family protein [Vagococcus intermedius]